MHELVVLAIHILLRLTLACATTPVSTDASLIHSGLRSSLCESRAAANNGVKLGLVLPNAL